MLLSGSLLLLVWFVLLASVGPLAAIVAIEVDSADCAAQRGAARALCAAWEAEGERAARTVGGDAWGDGCAVLVDVETPPCLWMLPRPAIRLPVLPVEVSILAGRDARGRRCSIVRYVTDADAARAEETCPGWSTPDSAALAAWEDADRWAGWTVAGLAFVHGARGVA